MKGDIKIGGNMNKKFWLEFTPWMYHVDIDNDFLLVYCKINFLM